MHSSRYKCIAKRCNLWSEAVAGPPYATRCFGAPDGPKWRSAPCRPRSGPPPASRGPRRCPWWRTPVTHPWRDGPDAHAGPARAPGTRPSVRPRRPPAARGRVRGGRGPRPSRVGRPDPPGGDRGTAARRLLPRRARRTGLVRDGAGPRPRAAGAGDRRPLVLHPRAIQRAHPLRSCAADPLSRPEHARRALRELCDHRGRRRLRCPLPAGHGRPRWRHRRLRPERREVVRHRSRRHRLHDLPLQRGRWGPATADAVPGRLRRARCPDQARPGLHAHVRRSPSPVRAPGRARAADRRPRRRRGRRRADQRVVRRGAHPHRGALHRGDGAAADPGGRVGDGARPVRRAHLRLPGRLVPAGRLGSRRLRRAAAHARDGLAGRHGRGPEGRPCQGVAGQAVRLGGGVPVRRPRRAGLRRSRLHAGVRGRSGSSGSSASTGSGRAPRRSSDSSSPARSRSAAWAGWWGDEGGLQLDARPSGHGRDRPSAALRAAIRGGRRGVAAELDRRDGPRQPAGDGAAPPAVTS